MSVAVVESSPLNSLLHDIGVELEGENVRYMKFLLQGHINKETLQYLDTGLELTEALRTRGLVTEKRLAFLRKLLVESKCLKLVNLVDDFKEKFAPTVSFGEKEGTEINAKRNSKRESMLRMMERLEMEISSNEEDETELMNDTKQYEVQIQANNERLVGEEDEISQLKDKIKDTNADIESYERKLETVRFFLKKDQVELEKIKKNLEKDKTNASLKLDYKVKMEKFEKGKKEEDALLSKHQHSLDDIRSMHVEIRHRTEEMIRLEDYMHDCFMQIRIVKQNIRKNQRMRLEMHEKLEGLTLELEETNRQKPLTPALSVREGSQMTSYIQQPNGQEMGGKIEFKILDYNEITERESTVIGRKGKTYSPPQFNTPVSVAADRWGNVYIADYGNARVQVLDVGGKVLREPLNIGGKCRPCALAVSLRGDLVMTDSQIVRVFNRNGQFVRPILPIFSRNDRRPELCSVSIDNLSNIYIGDRANHRIQKFNFEGQFLHFIGGPEDVNYPIGIAVTRHGDVIVCDHDKHQLKVFFHEDMTRAKAIGAKGIGLCKFASPRGISLDRDDNIVIADSQNHRIQVITKEGQYIGSFGTIGEDPGSFNTPYDVTVDTSGNIVVADTKNHRVQVFTRLVQIYVPFNEEPAKTGPEGGEAVKGGLADSAEGDSEGSIVDDENDGYQGDEESEGQREVARESHRETSDKELVENDNNNATYNGNEGNQKD